MTKLYQHIFSITNRGKHKLIRIMGFKFSIRIPHVKYSTLKNKSNLRFAFYVGCDDNRSERYRVNNIVEGLSKRSIPADRYYKNSIKILEKNVNKYNLLMVFRSGDGKDIDYFDEINDLYNSFILNNIPIIYDVDDLLFHHRQDTVSEAVSSLVKKSSMVTVTTSTLANFYKILNNNVHIVKNTINYKQYKLASKIKKYKSNKIRITYQSGTMSHNKDFLECSDAIYRILEENSHVEFHLIGPLELPSKLERFCKQVYKHKYMNYLELQKYVSQMDINIAPLEINDFNNSKSELKIFESALLKIPSVVSPIIPYKECIKDGHNGFIASNTDEWYEKLSLLIRDAELRQKMGENAYKEIVPKYYIENNIDEIIDLYREIIKKTKEEKIK